jgi:hypothetical protein
VGGSLLEHALELAIASQMRQPQSSKEREVLFSDTGIIGTFYQKIWVAYFTKIIGPQVRQDIDLVRKMRNLAAHTLGQVSFVQTAEVASRCRELKFLYPQADDDIDLRYKFLATVKVLAFSLIIKAAEKEFRDNEGDEVIKALDGFLRNLDQ